MEDSRTRHDGSVTPSSGSGPDLPTLGCLSWPDGGSSLAGPSLRPTVWLPGLGSIHLHWSRAPSGVDRAASQQARTLHAWFFYSGKQEARRRYDPATGLFV
jgi:hypothetical protein